MIMSKDTEIAVRVKKAVDFLREYGYAKNSSEVADTLGIAKSTLSMAMNGSRIPGTDFLLAISDHYPINFWWLRTGEGDMVGNGDRIIALLRKIEQLEGRIRELEEQTACATGKGSCEPEQ